MLLKHDTRNIVCAANLTLDYAYYVGQFGLLLGSFLLWVKINMAGSKGSFKYCLYMNKDNAGQWKKSWNLTDTSECK